MITSEAFSKRDNKHQEIHCKKCIALTLHSAL